MFRRHPQLNRENGQASVEFVIVLPFLLLILFAILQFGVVFKDYLALTDAVRAGARQGAVSRHEADPVVVTKGAVKAAASDLDDRLEIDVQSSWEPGTELEVSAKYPFKVEILWFIPLTEGWLESGTKERVE